MLVAVQVFAQDALNWFTLSEVGQKGGGLVAYNSGDITLGALVQLIRVTGGVSSDPIYSGNGTQGNDVVIDWSGVGYGAFDATFNNQGTLGTGNVYPTLASSSSVYVRVWNLPTSGSGNLPTPQVYAAEGGRSGAYYYQFSIAQISGLPSPGASIYNYEVPAITDASWTFLAVPEPGSMALGLLGLGVILIRRRLMRK